jgi:thymidylate kinase
VIIAFEGIDGSGKTTLAPRVAAELDGRGYSAVATTKRESIVQAGFAREQVEALAARLWGTAHEVCLNSVVPLHSVT